MSVAGRERRGTGKMELETALGPLGLRKLENCRGLRPCWRRFWALRLFFALAARRSLSCSLSDGCCISILPLP